MKAISILILCGFLSGCFHYHNAAPKGNNAPAAASALSDFTGVYMNSGLGASSSHESLSSFLFGYFDSRMERAEHLRLNCRKDGTLEFEVMNGAAVLERKVIKPEVDYVFRDGRIILGSYRKAGSSGSEAFPSVALRGHRRAMWLTRDKDLVGESVFSASGVAMGFIPGAGYSRDAWRWKRIGNEN